MTINITKKNLMHYIIGISFFVIACVLQQFDDYNFVFDGVDGEFSIDKITSNKMEVSPDS